jgi:hypothetical protein
MACFPGLVRGAGSPAGSSAVLDASWFAWSRVRWKTKAMFYGPFRARPVIHAEALGRRGRAGRETAPEPAPDPKGGR